MMAESTRSRVTSRSSGKEKSRRQGTRIVRSDQPIDLILTDVGLPVLNGRQVADIVDTLSQREGYMLATP